MITGSAPVQVWLKVRCRLSGAEAFLPSGLFFATKPVVVLALTDGDSKTDVATVIRHIAHFSSITGGQVDVV